ncbi:hypothetical protein K501DRAFT_277645 [Backusella circina FSU 941]|nr:hypothetical protein K501DRAFT_277645 [Backusella circina FSU 941]
MQFHFVIIATAFHTFLLASAAPISQVVQGYSLQTGQGYSLQAGRGQGSSGFSVSYGIPSENTTSSPSSIAKDAFMMGGKAAIFGSDYCGALFLWFIVHITIYIDENNFRL